MLDFIDFIEKTNNATEEEEIFQQFQIALEKLGFDRVLYSLMTDHPSIGKEAGHGIMRNYPDDWMKYYTEKQYVEIDPVRRHVMLSSQPFHWSEMGKNIPYSREQVRLINESKEAGLKHGVGLGIHCPNSESVGLGFASSDPSVEVTQSTLSLIKAVANQFHFAYSEFQKQRGQSKETPKVNLTRREREVLQWCAVGKSLSETAEILGISNSAVDYFMRNIFAKLEVNSKTFAVVKAIKYGLITV